MCQHLYSTLVFYVSIACFVITDGLIELRVKQIKELESELSQYKKIVAEQTLHITVLKDVVEKKLWSPLRSENWSNISM